MLKCNDKLCNDKLREGNDGKEMMDDYKKYSGIGFFVGSPRTSY